MSRIAVALAVLMVSFALPGLAFSEEASDAEIAAADAAQVKACLDVVEAKMDAEYARQQTDAPAAENAAPSFSPEAYLDKAARQKPKLAYEQCIGIVAEACLDTENGQGTLGMMGCYGRESDVWDSRLNASYREQTAQTESAKDKTLARHLRDVQKAWIPWRDATCEVLSVDGVEIYGSDARIEGVYCLMMLTARQALWVEGKTIMSFDAP
jgi:uncharacterized protein YecT (DUF1311 family)